MLGEVAPVYLSAASQRERPRRLPTSPAGMAVADTAAGQGRDRAKRTTPQEVSQVAPPQPPGGVRPPRRIADHEHALATADRIAPPLGGGGGRVTNRDPLETRTARGVSAPAKPP